MAKYSSTSPYFATPQNEVNLETFVPRTITAEEDELVYERFEDTQKLINKII